MEYFPKFSKEGKFSYDAEKNTVYFLCLMAYKPFFEKDSRKE